MCRVRRRRRRVQHRLCKGACEPRVLPAGNCPRHSSPGWRGGAGTAWNTFHTPLAGWRWRRSTPAEHTLQHALANRFSLDGRPRVGRGKVPAGRCVRPGSLAASRPRWVGTLAPIGLHKRDLDPQAETYRGLLATSKGAFRPAPVARRRPRGATGRRVGELRFVSAFSDVRKSSTKFPPCASERTCRPT